MVTVDLVVFAWEDSGLKSLFIQRKRDPFAGRWAIPGGYLEMDESIQNAAVRELREETGLESPALVEEIGVFGDPGRDPRGRTISIAHAGIVRGPFPRVRGGDDAKEAAWLDPHDVQNLAFDHNRIVLRAVDWLKAAVERDDVAFGLLPRVFSERDVNSWIRRIRGPKYRGAVWIRQRLRDGRIEPVQGSDGLFGATSRNMNPI